MVFKNSPSMYLRMYVLISTALLHKLVFVKNVDLV